MIYVDSLMEHTPGAYHGKDAEQAKRVGDKNGHRWCHMVSDQGASAPELHAMAAKLGLKRGWFQGDHYDLTPGRRSAALALGAIEADREKIVAIFKANRLIGTAREAMRAAASARRLKCNGCGFILELKPGQPIPPSCPKCNRGAKKPEPELPPL